MGRRYDLGEPGMSFVPSRRGRKVKTKMSTAELQSQDLVFVIEEKPHEGFQ